MESEMKTQDTAINAVYLILKGDSGVTPPVYKYTKPTYTTPDEFYVLNALPITNGVMQRVYINVNFYAKDIGDGIPDIVTLQDATSEVMTLLEETDGDLLGTGYLIDFESQEYHREPEINMHYSNIRLSVKLIN